MTHDADNLYMAFQIDKPADHEWVMQTEKPREMSTVREDTVELWLSNDDGTITNQTMLGHRGWMLSNHKGAGEAPRLRYANSQDQRQWTGELAIPLSDLAPFGDGDSLRGLRVNLALTIYPHTIEGERQYYSWAPLARMFDDPSAFPYLSILPWPGTIATRQTPTIHDGRAQAEFTLVSRDFPGDSINTDFVVTNDQQTLLDHQFSTSTHGDPPTSQDRMKVAIDELLAAPNHATPVWMSVTLAMNGQPLYRRTSGAMLKPEYDFVLTPNPSRKRILIGLQMREGSKWSPDYHLKARLIRNAADGANQILASQEWTDATGFPLIWPVPDLLPGRHTVEITAYDAANRQIAQAEQNYQLPEVEFDFLNGWTVQVDQVPPPFKPVVIQKANHVLTVDVVDREFQFTPESLLPAQVTSLQQPLLASPAVVELNGQALGDVQWKEMSSSNIEVVLEGVAHAVDGDVQIRLNITLDGLARADLTLQPHHEQAWNVDSLTLVFPWQTTRSTYMAHTMGERGDREAFYGRSPDQAASFPFRRWFWLGDLDCGMGLTFEGRGNWFNQAGAKPIMLDASDHGTRRLSIALINQPLKLSQPRTITFGLMPTPTKPLQSGWSMHNVAIGGGGRLSALSEQIKREPAEFWSDPQFIHTFIIQSWAPRHYGKTGLQDIFSFDFDQQAYRQTFTEFEQGGFHAVPWMQFESNDLKPAYDYYLAEWMRQPPRIFDPTGNGKMFWTTPSGSWAAALGKTLLLYIDRFNIGGVYFDTGMPSPSTNELWDEGYIDEAGNLQPTLPIFATHRLKMNLFLAASQKKPGFKIISLINGTLLPPMISFDQAVVSGEEWNATFTGDYTKLADLQSRDRLAVKMNCKLWGVEHILLPSRGNWDKKHRDKILGANQTCDTYLLYALTCGCPTWVAYVDYGRFYHRAKLVQEFLADYDAAFFPHWQVQSPDAVLAAAYLGNNQLLLILGNRSDQPVAVDISQLDWPQSVQERINLGGNWVDLETSDVIASPLSIPPKNFRLIRLQSNPQKGE